MRTQAAILNRIASQNDADETEILRQYLSYVNAGSPAMPSGGAAEWNAAAQALDPVEHLRVVCAVAWNKIRAHRLDRTGRNVGRIKALVWLIGDQTAIDAVQNATGKHGAGKLAALCTHFGFPIPNEERLQRMIADQTCEPGCTRGC